MNEQSPVDVIIGIRKELAEFQRTSSRQELLAALKVACRAALPRWTAAEPLGDGFDVCRREIAAPTIL